MSLGTSNRDGGKTSESGHLRAIYKALIGEVISGLAVSQRGAGANMSVDIAIGDAVLPRSDATYGHPVFNDAILNKVVATADPSNPRRDIVILYLDYTVTPSTGVSNNTNGVVLTKIVAGTPAGSPTDPSADTLQAAAGSGNPYVKLSRVRVGAGVTSIANSVIDDLRAMASGSIQGGWIYDPTYDWVYASASTFTIAGVDVTAQFPKGAKIALYQSGAIKYFIVSAAAFSTNTTITLGGLGVYSLTNVPVDRPAYSYNQTPVGFPAAGVVPYVPYKFSVSRNAAQNTSAGAYVKVNWDNKEFDTGVNFDIATNFRFVAPVTGAYFFNWQVGVPVTGAGADNLTVLYKNGVAFKWGNEVSYSGGLNGGSLVSAVLGDYFEIFVFTVSTVALNPSALKTYFSGFLVGAI